MVHTHQVLRLRRRRRRPHPPFLHLRLRPQQCSSTGNRWREGVEEGLMQAHRIVLDKLYPSLYHSRDVGGNLCGAAKDQ